MQRIIKSGLCILLVFLAGVIVRAEVQSIDNFDVMTTGNLGYNIPTDSGGGIWSTTQGGTSGNIVVEVNAGSNVVRFMTTTAGDGRGFGFAGIDNAIEDTEKGVLFFRFMVRS